MNSSIRPFTFHQCMSNPCIHDFIHPSIHPSTMTHSHSTIHLHSHQYIINTSSYPSTHPPSTIYPCMYRFIHTHTFLCLHYFTHLHTHGSIYLFTHAYINLSIMNLPTTTHQCICHPFIQPLIYASVNPSIIR